MEKKVSGIGAETLYYARAQAILATGKVPVDSLTKQ